MNTYDLRLELGSVLVSWAVPGGLTLDRAVRRLAVHIEDHPIEYLDFEKVVPSAEYGGDAIVWDADTWELPDTDDPAAWVAVKAARAAYGGNTARAASAWSTVRGPRSNPPGRHLRRPNAARLGISASECQP